MRQIERAVAKIKNGTYGACEGCQTKIPVARLNALPYSTLCVKCQRDMEATPAGGRPRRRELGSDRGSWIAGRTGARRPEQPGNGHLPVTTPRTASRSQSPRPCSGRRAFCVL